VRVDRCFAFVDLCGFTAYADRHGDGAAVAALTALRTTLREVAARRGVRVVKWLGDGAMLSATEPAPVVALVVELTSRAEARGVPLSVRAGLAAGPVIMFEGDDYVGRPPNVASRLCGSAEPDGVLATPDVAAGAPGWVAATGPTAFVVPGLDEPVDTARLQVDPSGPRAHDPCCGLDLPAGAVLLDAEGRGESFCSEACASTWADAHRRPAPAST
jgi:class 3 adenylate cyclase